MSTKQFTKGMEVVLTPAGHKAIGYVGTIRGTVAHTPRGERVGVIFSWQSTVNYYHPSFWKPA